MLRVFFITSISCSESIKRGLNFKLDQVFLFCDSIKVWTDNAAGKDVSKQQLIFASGNKSPSVCSF